MGREQLEGATPEPAEVGSRQWPLGLCRRVILDTGPILGTQAARPSSGCQRAGGWGWRGGSAEPIEEVGSQYRGKLGR